MGNQHESMRNPSSDASDSKPPMDVKSESMGKMLAAMTGGKRRSRRAKKAGSSCGMRKKGGMKMSKKGGMKMSKKGGMKMSKKGGMKMSKKGGMAMGMGAMVREALVPFGLYSLQKRTQRKKSMKHHKRSKSSRRR
jgi:hypothetical protein